MSRNLQIRVVVMDVNGVTKNKEKQVNLVSGLLETADREDMETGKQTQEKRGWGEGGLSQSATRV